MARLIDYSQVLSTLQTKGLQCLYFNSGAFGFAEGVATESVGWLIRDDATLRASARSLARLIAPGTPLQLSQLAGMVWEEKLAGQSVLLMPKSNWSYEFQFGSESWLPEAMAQAGVDAGLLRSRHDGAGVEFSLSERPAFEQLIATLLERLAGSDFQLVFSAATAICTVHHHKQLWWTTRNTDLSVRLRGEGAAL